MTRTVRPIGIRRRGLRALLAPLLVGGLAACSSSSDRDDADAWYNKTMVENFAGRSSAQQAPAYAAPGGAPGGRIAAPIDNELYRSEGSCGGMVLDSPGARPHPAFPSASTISLEMTECDVVRRAGPPDRMELTTNERGERFLGLTYARGERPRLYQFAAGRLVAIENLVPATPRGPASKTGRPTTAGR